MVCFLADKLVIIGAGHEQLHAYKLASKIGLKTIGVDKNKLAPGLKWLTTELFHLQEIIRRF